MPPSANFMAQMTLKCPAATVGNFLTEFAASVVEFRQEQAREAAAQAEAANRRMLTGGRQG